MMIPHCIPAPTLPSAQSHLALLEEEDGLPSCRQSRQCSLPVLARSMSSVVNIASLDRRPVSARPPRLQNAEESRKEVMENDRSGRVPGEVKTMSFSRVSSWIMPMMEHGTTVAVGEVEEDGMMVKRVENMVTFELPAVAAMVPGRTSPQVPTMVPEFGSRPRREQSGGRSRPPVMTKRLTRDRFARMAHLLRQVIHSDEHMAIDPLAFASLRYFRLHTHCRSSPVPVSSEKAQADAKCLHSAQ
jgi:hypothetical protein